MKRIRADGKEEEKMAVYTLKVIVDDKMKWLRKRTNIYTVLL